MNTNFTAAAVQLNSNNNMPANIKKASALISQAAEAGAEFIALPENAFLMGASDEEKLKFNLPMAEHVAVLAMRELAAKLKIWLLFGVAVGHNSIPPNNPLTPPPKPLLSPAKAPKKLYNRCILVNPNGKIINYYDKIHMFDVDIINGESHRESASFEPGEQAVVANLPWAKLGLTICYDLRFPTLFRALAHAGAQIITVPSAFTHKTGAAHWHALLRARAIETTSYIIAPAQCGHHPRNRHTYGHSIIISPWGEILAEASENKEEFIIAKVNIDELNELRNSLPSLRHDRQFKLPTSS